MIFKSLGTPALETDVFRAGFCFVRSKRMQHK